MNISRLDRSLIVTLMVIFAGIVVHAPMSVWLGTIFPDHSLLIKSWKEILLVVAVLLAITIITRRQLWQEMLRDWLCLVIAGYIALHILLTPLFYQGALATAAGLAIDLRYVIFFGLVYVTIKLFPQYRRRFVQIAIVGSSIVVVFATLQLFLPADILSHIGYSKDTIMPYLTVDKNPEFVRVNSTLRGPNPLGAYAGVVLGLLTAALVRRKLDLKDKKVLIGTVLFGACATTALWISYSRSALVAGIVAVGIVLFASILRKLSRRAWIITCVMVCALIGGLIVARDSTFVSNVLLHENPSGGSQVSSNEEHVESLAYGTDRLLNQPLRAGIGSTGSASLRGNEPVIIENQYLFIAHETGWLGLILFMAIFFTILARLWRGRADWLSLGVFASGVGLALIGLLLPVWVDDTVSIVWWGLAAITLAKGTYDRRQTK